MTTMSEMKQELTNWKPFLGQPAMIESTSYFPLFGNSEKPFVKLQRNVLADIKFHSETTTLAFEEKGRGYGLLGNNNIRTPKESHFTAADVRAYAMNKVMKDERFGSITLDKENLEIGQHFFYLSKSLHTGSFAIHLVTLTEYSLTNGMFISGFSDSVPEEEIYSFSDLDNMLDEIEKFANLLLVPTERKSTKLEFDRFLVNVKTDKNDKVTTLVFDEEFFIPEIRSHLEEKYKETQAVAVITDTASHHMYHWTNVEQ